MSTSGSEARRAPGEPRHHDYALALTWTGAAGGPTRDYRSFDRTYTVAIQGKPPLVGSSDPLFRGDPSLPNPEDLLLAAVASCHMLSFLAEAARNGVLVHAYDDEPTGTMRFEGGSGQFVEVVLRPHATVAAGTDPQRVERLHARAHADCFIARSVNFPVRHEPRLTILPALGDGAAP